MLFSNISIWVLTCYKWKSRQVVTISKDSGKYLAKFEVLEIWLNVVFGVCHTIHTSTPIFSTETETKEKGKLKLQHLYQMISDMQTPSHLWFTLFKLDEKLTSLGKLFENVSTTEFLRDTYLGHCLISRVKIMNNVLNRIRLYWMYILANLDY